MSRHALRRQRSGRIHQRVGRSFPSATRQLVGRVGQLIVGRSSAHVFLLLDSLSWQHLCQVNQTDRSNRSIIPPAFQMALHLGSAHGTSAHFTWPKSCLSSGAYIDHYFMYKHITAKKGESCLVIQQLPRTIPSFFLFQRFVPILLCSRL